MSTVRLRRLQSDADRLMEMVRRHPRLQLIQAEGAPPEQYQLGARTQEMLAGGSTVSETRVRRIGYASRLR